MAQCASLIAPYKLHGGHAAGRIRVRRLCPPYALLTGPHRVFYLRDTSTPRLRCQVADRGQPKTYDSGRENKASYDHDNSKHHKPPGLLQLLFHENSFGDAIKLQYLTTLGRFSDIYWSSI